MKVITKYAAHLILAIIAFALLYHVSIMLQLVDYKSAWGGRLTSEKEMYAFETFSCTVNLFLAWIVMMKAGMVKQFFSDRFLNITLWIFIVLFALNTIGNLLAKTILEKGFAILTLSLALLIWNLVSSKKTNIP